MHRMSFGRAARLVTGVTLVAATTAVAVASPARADEIRDRQWHLAYLDIASAHAISQGEGVVVAMIDSGIDEDHPDLAGNVLEGIDVAVGGDGNGWGDVDGHGTGMAGLVVAHGHGPGNAEGALGIAPQAKILPLRIKTDGTYGDGVALGLAVDEAVARGAKIIAIPVNSDGQSYDAVQRALAAGVMVVASTGNQPRETMMGSPAADPGVTAVGAVGPDGIIADVSVRASGLGRVALTAPGVDIVSSSNDAGYRIGTGTSPSTAIVAGVAALVWSRYPDLTNVELLDHLTATAVDKGAPGQDPEYGFGLVDPMAALTTEPERTPTTTTSPPLPTAPVTVPDGDEAAASPSGSDDGAGPAVLAAGVGGAIILAAIVAIALRRRRAVAAAPGGPTSPGQWPPPGPPPTPPPPPYGRPPPPG
jgi:subtilisin family serine protease